MYAGNEHCMKLEGVSARNNVDYSSVKNTKQKSSIKSRSTLTKEFERSLGLAELLISQTDAPSEPGGAYSTPPPRNKSSIKISSSSCNKQFGSKSQPSELQKEK